MIAPVRARANARRMRLRSGKRLDLDRRRSVQCVAILSEGRFLPCPRCGREVIINSPSPCWGFRGREA